MSMFEYYEFQAIDRELSVAEQKELDNISSRARVNRRKAVFTYSYGNFRKTEEELMETYFDFGTYLTNYGRFRFYYKFPANLIDFDAVKEYAISIDDDDAPHSIEVYKKEDFVFINIEIHNDENCMWIDDENDMSSDFIKLRKDILSGDYRALFIFWLNIVSIKLAYYQNDDEDYDDDDDDDEDHNKPKSFLRRLIPANLGKKKASLTALVEFLELDEAYIKAAAKLSTAVETSIKQPDYAQLISALPTEQKHEFLLKIISEQPNIKMELLKALNITPPKSDKTDKESIDFEEFSRLVALEKN